MDNAPARLNNNSDCRQGFLYWVGPGRIVREIPEDAPDHGCDFAAVPLASFTVCIYPRSVAITIGATPLRVHRHGVEVHARDPSPGT